MILLSFFNSTYISNINTVSIIDILLTLIFSLAIGSLIYLVYKKTFSGIMYSTSFAISLISMTMITSVLILAVTSNVILSLGMVGAISIVRFRTAVKDPIDIIFLFWAIGSGIIIAAGLIVLAILSSIAIAVVLIICLNKKVHNSPYLLVLNLSVPDEEEEILKIVKEHVARVILKSKTISPESLELNYEVCLKDNDSTFIQQLSKMAAIRNIALVSYNGEYMN